jgi:hypothetical protein
MDIVCIDNCQYESEEHKEVPVRYTGPFGVQYIRQTCPWNRELEKMRDLELDNNTCFYVTDFSFLLFRASL